MKPIKVIIILFLFVAHLLSAQTNNGIKMVATKFDSVTHQRIYQIKTGKHQTLELLEFKNGEFEGSLINSVFKMDRRNNLELMNIKINVPAQTVKTLMNELKQKQFENIPNCTDIKNCINETSGSFSTVRFTSITEGKFHEYYYQNSKSDDNKTLSEDHYPAQELLSVITNETNLEKEFQNFLSRLPDGKYTYDAIIFTKKTRVRFLD